MKKAGVTGKIIAVFFWLAVWQLLAVCTHNSILLVSPVTVMIRLSKDVQDISFWMTILTSAYRIMTGFLCAFVLGSLFGILAYQFRWIHTLLAPLMNAVISVPVASFVVILLIWFGSENLSIWIAFLISFPNLYIQMQEGIESADTQLVEVAKIYHISAWNQAWYLYRPALTPFLRSACTVSIGMAWKSGVAAEVIGLPDASIGERIYMSKIYLDTAGVLSWTIVCVLLSVIIKKLLLLLLNYLMKCKVPMIYSEGIEADKQNREIRTNQILNISELSKIYDDKVIINHWNETLIAGHIYAIMNPSGSGKTTLFRILSGLENADEGTINYIEEKETANICEYHQYESAVAFQENRFFENLTAAENLALTCGNSKTRTSISEWNLILEELLPSEELGKPMSQFSGGMARRVEVIRCMISDKKLLLLDEPFNGLDLKMKQETANFIMKYQNHRIVIVATHSEEEGSMLQADKINIRQL